MFRYNRSHLSLVIAATSNCNFRCVYCYEGSVLRASTMSEAIQEAIVKFVESEAPHLETFTVTWYGGEPLLALDIIENLSIKFVDICKKNAIAYDATIVTNGYLLNCTVIEKLNTLHVNQYNMNEGIFVYKLSKTTAKGKPLKMYVRLAYEYEPLDLGKSIVLYNEITAKLIPLMLRM